MGTEINHCRLSVIGSNVALPGEIWMTGVNLYPKLGDPMDDIQETSNDFEAATDSLTSSGTGWTGSSNFLLEGGVNDINPLDYLEDQALVALDSLLSNGNFSDQLRIDTVELYAVDNDGKVCQLPVGPAKASISYTASWIKGTSSAGILAPFTSFDVQLSTIADIPRGRGRIFPPPVVTSMLDNNTGLLDDSVVTSYLTNTKSFVNELKLGTGIDPTVSMFPCVIGSPWTTAYKVTSLRVNNIPGTQRRRKNGLTPDFSTLAL